MDERREYATVNSMLMRFGSRKCRGIYRCVLPAYLRRRIIPIGDLGGRDGPMDRGNDTGMTGGGTAQRGLWRLMLKLPALRGRLQILATKSSSLNDLCEAYEEASLALERLLQDQQKADPFLVEEYETIRAEIESDIIQYVLEHHSAIPK